MKTERPWELVMSYDYFNNVLKNLAARANAVGIKPQEIVSNHDDRVTVRFGLNGHGVHPNYQIEAAGSVVAFSGQNHEVYYGAPDGSFEPNNLSEERFSYQDVLAMRKKA